MKKNMKIKELYSYARFNIDIINHLAGVLPSTGLSLVHPMGRDNVCYVIMTNETEGCGHYIVLIECSKYFEIFDPLATYCLKDSCVRTFIIFNPCVLNTVPCQKKRSLCCGWYCLFYLLVRCKNIDRYNSLHYMLNLSMDVENTVFFF